MFCLLAYLLIGDLCLL